MTKALLVAGTGSGTGKTTVVLGLLAAARQAGLSVRSFKSGPDFIDPGLHELVTGEAAHTLDPWMMGSTAAAEVLARRSRGADLVVLEGAMGLFDGGPGSAARLARLLGLPVFLVVDARGMGPSAAAVVLGFARHDENLELSGVFLNRLGGPKHERLIAEAVGGLDLGPNFRVLGLPRQDDLVIGSRHLGLMTREDFQPGPGWVERLARWFTSAVNVRALVDGLPDLDVPPHPVEAMPPARVRLGLARDQAFCFVYHENLRLLRAAGAEIVVFSPLRDHSLPEDLDGLWLPGGYPELHVRNLEANESMRRAVADFAASGRPIYAECGGFLYLLGELGGPDGLSGAMCGVLDGRSVLEKRFQALGYREIVLNLDCFLGPAKARLRGHEFHYCRLESDPAGAENVSVCTDAEGLSVHAPTWLTGNVLASFVHVHLGFRPESAAWMVEWMAR